MARKNRQPQTDRTSPEPTTRPLRPVPEPPPSDPQTMPPMLLCSLGNPGSSYANTLHSAGHIALAALVRHVSAPAPIRSAAQKALVTSLTPHMFWFSPKYMNDSGRAVASAWRDFKRSLPNDTVEPRLVILHDELEAKTGTFKIKRDTVGMSARGHNGLKSILEQPGMRTEKITRVGIGIGPRPASREPDDVAAFVLRAANSMEKQRIESCAEGIWKALNG
ncbi:MAG: hypothetical protein Q9159_001947 [Coniocarpon cinnabarinum]